MPTAHDIIDLLLWIVWDAYVIASGLLLGLYFGKIVAEIIIMTIERLRK